MGLDLMVDSLSVKVSLGVQPRAESSEGLCNWPSVSDVKEFVSRRPGCVEIYASFLTFGYLFSYYDLYCMINDLLGFVRVMMV